ncbi:MAG: hypothetical protein ACM3S1_08670 [Hyphomicrobiales bacterium]
MRTTGKLAIPLFAVLLAGTLGLPGVALAAAGAEMTVVLPKETLNASVNLPERPTVKTLGEAVGSVMVLVDGTECLTLNLAPTASHGQASEDVRGTLGADGQPEACSKDGAGVTFRDAAGRTLFEKATFEPGGTIVLSNLAPEPPSDGPSENPPGPPAAGSGMASSGTSPLWWFAAAALGIACASGLAASRRR